MSLVVNIQTAAGHRPFIRKRLFVRTPLCDEILPFIIINNARSRHSMKLFIFYLRCFHMQMISQPKLRCNHILCANLFRKPMTSHAPRAWWLEPAKYAPRSLNPATRGVPRVPPSRLAAPLHSDFLRGDLKKGMGGKGEGRLPFRKKEGRDSNTSGSSPCKIL